MSNKVGASGQSSSLPRSHGNPPPSLQEGDRMHTVQRGDTLAGIARQHNLSTQEVVQANPQIQNPGQIWPGDQVRLPGPAQESTPTAQASPPAVTQQYFGNQFEAGSPQPTPSFAPPPVPYPSVQSGPAAPSTNGPTAGDLATGATAAGGPAQLLDDVAQSSARTVRTYANASQARMAQVFAQGGEDALQATQAHRAAAHLDAAAARTAQTASRIRTAGAALNVAGGVLTGVDQYNNSNAQTTAGRSVSATGAGSLAVAVGARHPYFAAADAAANLLGAPDTPSNVLNRSVDSITTVGEGLITGDTRGMESLHQRNLQGNNGPVFQAAAEAGDFWADHGVVGGLGMFGDAVGDTAGDLWDSIF